MPRTASRGRSVDVTGLARRLYLYSFFDDLVLLYPVYALLFADSGLSVADISAMFILWSLTGLVAEVPSGVLADATSRRMPLVIAPLLSAAGFGLWVALPHHSTFAVGFILWGIKGALQSGSLEALIYEELQHRHSTEQYATIIGRSEAASTVGILLATALAAPVMLIGGYVLLGIASVAAGVAGAVVAWTFPERRECARAPEGHPWREYLATLRAGLRQIRRHRPALRAVLLVPAVTVIWGNLEEYTPLLAAGATQDRSTVPVLILMISLGIAAGGLLSGRAAGLPMIAIGVIIAASAVAMAAGALSAHPLGFALLGLAFAGFQLSTIVAQTRLQERIRGSSRATVTSLAGLLTELAGMAVYLLYGLGSAVTGHPVAFALGASVYLLLAAVLVLAARFRRAVLPSLPVVVAVPARQPPP